MRFAVATVATYLLAAFSLPIVSASPAPRAVSHLDVAGVVRTLEKRVVHGYTLQRLLSIHQLNHGRKSVPDGVEPLGAAEVADVVERLRGVPSVVVATFRATSSDGKTFHVKLVVDLDQNRVLGPSAPASDANTALSTPRVLGWADAEHTRLWQNDSDADVDFNQYERAPVQSALLSLGRECRVLQSLVTLTDSLANTELGKDVRIPVCLDDTAGKLVNGKLLSVISNAMLMDMDKDAAVSRGPGFVVTNDIGDPVDAFFSSKELMLLSRRDPQARLILAAEVVRQVAQSVAALHDSHDTSGEPSNVLLHGNIDASTIYVKILGGSRPTISATLGDFGCGQIFSGVIPGAKAHLRAGGQPIAGQPLNSKQFAVNQLPFYSHPFASLHVRAPELRGYRAEHALTTSTLATIALRADVYALSETWMVLSLGRPLSAAMTGLVSRASLAEHTELTERFYLTSLLNELRADGRGARVGPSGTVDSAAFQQTSLARCSSMSECLAVLPFLEETLARAGSPLAQLDGTACDGPNCKAKLDAFIAFGLHPAGDAALLEPFGVSRGVRPLLDEIDSLTGLTDVAFGQVARHLTTVLGESGASLLWSMRRFNPSDRLTSGEVASDMFMASLISTTGTSGVSAVDMAMQLWGRVAEIFRGPVGAAAEA
jgi:serine/threonine protein kinase